MKGFTGDTPHCEPLREVCAKYAKYRLGLKNFLTPHDELTIVHEIIATWTIQLCKAATKNKGTGKWTLLYAHLISDHLRKFKVTPIAFSPIEDEDIELEEGARTTNSKDIWVSGTKYRVEAREHVREQLKAFLVNECGFLLDDTMYAVNEEPQQPPTPDGNPVKRRRVWRSL